MQGQYPQMIYTQSPYQMVTQAGCSVGYGNIFPSNTQVSHLRQPQLFDSPVMVQPSSVSVINSPNNPVFGYLGVDYANNMMVASTQSSPVEHSTTALFSPSYVTSVVPSAVKTSMVPCLYINQNPSGCTVPQNISCNIRPVPIQNEIPNATVAIPSTPLRTCSIDTSMSERATEASGKSVNVTTESMQRIRAGLDFSNDSEDWYSSKINYSEYVHGSGSNLYVTWSKSAYDLKYVLESHNLEVLCILNTDDDSIFNVVFDNHLTARRAFIKQRSILLRMVPPKNSKKNWLKSASPKFLVKYETRRRLRVREGKALSHAIVGDLVMSNCENRTGCII